MLLIGVFENMQLVRADDYSNETLLNTCRAPLLADRAWCAYPIAEEQAAFQTVRCLAACKSKFVPTGELVPSPSDCQLMPP